MKLEKSKTPPIKILYKGILFDEMSYSTEHSDWNCISRTPIKSTKEVTSFWGYACSHCLEQLKKDTTVFSSHNNDSVPCCYIDGHFVEDESESRELIAFTIEKENFKHIKFI